jgi:phage tail-like protein
MARAQNSDFLLSFRFQLETIEKKGARDPLAFPIGGGSAGFQSVTLPEVTLEATEYREGIYKYTRKYPGPPTISEVSCMRGVMKKDTAFFDWCISALSGAEYRADIKILQYSRGNLPGNDGGVNPAEFKTEDFAALAARQYNCYQCVPVRVKPAGDLDATSGEVSMAEVDFAPEYFTIEIGAG